MSCFKISRWYESDLFNEFMLSWRCSKVKILTFSFSFFPSLASLDLGTSSFTWFSSLIRIADEDTDRVALVIFTTYITMFSNICWWVLGRFNGRSHIHRSHVQSKIKRLNLIVISWSKDHHCLKCVNVRSPCCMESASVFLSVVTIVCGGRVFLLLIYETIKLTW